MSSIRPGVIALILALTVVTSGITALQSAGGAEGAMSASLNAIAETQQALQGETSTKTNMGGLSAASPDGNKDKNRCEEGEFLAKYEFEDGKDLNGDGDTIDWVYVEGPAGDVFTVTTLSDNPAEPRHIRWESSDPSVTWLEAKNGKDVDTEDYDYEWPTEAELGGPDQDKSYSDIVFCGPLTFQLDLIEGQPREKLQSNDDLYRPEGRLDTSAYVSSEGDIFQQRTLVKDLECVENPSQITMPDPSTASITFDVKDDPKCDDLEISLAAYELPGDKQSFGLPQVLADSDTVTVDLESGQTYTLTVELKDTSN